MMSEEQRVEAVARAIWGTRKDAPDGDYSLRMNLSWDEARRAATNAIASLQPLEDTEEGLREALIEARAFVECVGCGDSEEWAYKAAKCLVKIDAALSAPPSPDSHSSTMRGD